MKPRQIAGKNYSQRSRGRNAGNAVAAPYVTAVWDQASKSPNIDISNSGLTATANAGGTNYSSIRSTLGKTFGKYYCELHCDLLTAIEVVGLLTANQSMSTFLGNVGSDSIGWISTSGQILVNNVIFAAAAATYGTGVTICIATDLNNKVEWFRVGAGAWTYAASNDQVSAGSSGIALNTLNVGPYYIGATTQAPGDAFTLNTGAAPYLYPVPEGFGNWDVLATNYVAEGDSQCSIGLSTGPAFPQLYSTSRHGVQERTRAISGSVLADLVTRAAGTDALLVGGVRNVLSVILGNDNFHAYTNYGGSRTAYVAAVASYLDARRAAGWKVVLCATCPRTDASIYSRVGFNTDNHLSNATFSTWVGTHCDAYCDFMADPVMGPDAAAADTTLYVDGTHVTTLGAHNLTAIITPFLNAV